MHALGNYSRIRNVIYLLLSGGGSTNEMIGVMEGMVGQMDSIFL